MLVRLVDAMLGTFFALEAEVRRNMRNLVAVLCRSAQRASWDRNGCGAELLCIGAGKLDLMVNEERFASAAGCGGVRDCAVVPFLDSVSPVDRGEHER